ncbi:NAD(P)/FAD-dependent oxidoreductase [Flavobacterium sp. DG1-102-2]|uniref:flavin monoamine oxidase family protein n=1 Tax=Flavobacterium sp. DG1-102-2 TaxID=3081663 RepID=UPI00294A9273|nr:NAD(P)/FAD-dependent oxidoreductase [Flavobacterium sp. DG1-102-2]MDV6168226.1 NAD(P)/FAD-dependent oxidoreductase [Flavobacterium sp. DG1-102-2]
MKRTDVIIIGGGAAGLMAAYGLVKAGKSIRVLEARNRLGGRIHTIKENGFSGHVELGAEFVHGKLPVTLNLLREAGIEVVEVGFEMWQYRETAFKQNNEFIEGWNGLLEKLNSLEKDMTLHDFLEQHYSGKEREKQRAQIENYVAGYDTADALDASVFSLRREWNNEDEDSQFRLKDGYQTMVQYLADACTGNNNEILLNTIAKEVLIEDGRLKVITNDGIVYEAQQAIVALPLGVLQSEEGEGSVKFNPQLYSHLKATQNIGFGSVIKILLEFDEMFWEDTALTSLNGSDLSGMGFLFADTEISTFWTQSPNRSTLLTGWIGGPPAYKIKDLPDQEIMKMAIASLSHVFKIAPEKLQNKLTAWNVANWTSESFTRGSYAYDKVKSPEARKVLQEPFENTIYFAGEYLYDGPAMGTVEAALTSGKQVAEMILE